MMRKLVIVFSALLVLTLPQCLYAQAAPHNVGCAACHRQTLQPSAAGTLATGNAGLCISCHNPTAVGGAVSVQASQAAEPGQSGSSHAWNVAPINEELDTLAPQIGAVSGALLDGMIVCSTCHDQHSHDSGEPFLRASNDNDELCLDCHRARDLGRWVDDPAANIGSHPVRVSIDPTNQDMHPPADGGYYLPLKEEGIVCSTCHSVHRGYSDETLWFHATGGDAERTSAVVDGAGWTTDTLVGREATFISSGENDREIRSIIANDSDTLWWNLPLPVAVAPGDGIALAQPGEGDGYLLRAPNDETLCQACHLYEGHPTGERFSCRDCHEPHDTTNILLVADVINGHAVDYSSKTPPDFIHGAPDYDGVCETCHTNTRYHRNNSTGSHDHNNGTACTDCHLHSEGFKAECGTCHAATPETLTTGSHPMHFADSTGPGIATCSACHGEGADTASHAGHNNGVVNFNGVATESLAQTSACNTCHSPSGFFDGVNDSNVGAKALWATGAYSSPGVLSASATMWCEGCHDDNPQTVENESSLVDGVSAPSRLGDNTTFGFLVTGHGRSGSSYPAESWQAESDAGNPPGALDCTACHDASAPHFDGQPGSVDRLRNGFAPDQNNDSCTQCHKEGEAAWGPPEYFVDSVGYEASEHGRFLCTACHDVHGDSGTGAAMTTSVEEELCARCHNDVVQAFGGLSHHDIDDAEQAVNGSRIECTMCHNPHIASETNPLISLDDPTSGWTADTRGFCLVCHDGDPPSGVVYPAQAPGASWDQSGYEDHPHDNPQYSCDDCHGPHGSTNLLLVRPVVNGRSVVFTSREAGGFTSGDPDYNGICEVCHTQTAYHQNNPAGDHTHNTQAPCTACHAHEQEFTASCGSCHDATPETLNTGSHATHFGTEIGPGIQSCDECHGNGAQFGMHAGHNNGTVNFLEGAQAGLTSTAACDSCHSPDGISDGVSEAKGAWATGVYLAPGTLHPAHARWCQSCHDDDPATAATNESAVIGGVYAPPVYGDSQTYGYYVTGHGRKDTRFPTMSWQSEGANGNPAANMACSWCHDLTAKHIDGSAGTELRFKPGFAPDQDNTGCNQCHREGGAGNSLPTYYTHSAAYEDSAHGGLLCTACHDPHGQGGPGTAMSPEIEEALCAECHQNEMNEFGMTNHHDIDDAEQATNGSRVECTMCHNPHNGTKGASLANPDNPTLPWGDAGMREFCLACHDAQAPDAVEFPATSPGTGWDQTAFIGTRHDVTLGGDCTLCHNAHGSDSLATLRANYAVADYTSSSTSAYALCFTCHDSQQILNGDDAFREYHKKHIIEERSPCIACHNAHAPYDANESGLIYFEYGLNHGFNISLTTGGTTYTPSSAFLDTGDDRGRCYLRCHGEGHNGESYTGYRVTTVDCLQCHQTQP